MFASCPYTAVSTGWQKGKGWMANSKIRRVYLAGPLTPRGIKSTNAAVEYLLNVRDMAKAAVDLILRGYAPFCPALDGLLFLVQGEGQRITEPQIKRFSKDWLEACDAMLLIEGWQTSLGTAKEIEFAMAKGIPVFKSLQELEDFQKEGK